MITVSISINNRTVFARSAVNVQELADGVCEYEIDDGRKVQHKRSDGAIPLAIQMLSGICEPGNKRVQR